MPPDRMLVHRFLVLLVLLVGLASAVLFFGGAEGVTGGGEGGGVFLCSATQERYTYIRICLLWYCICASVLGL